MLFIKRYTGYVLLSSLVVGLGILYDFQRSVQAHSLVPLIVDHRLSDPVKQLFALVGQRFELPEEANRFAQHEFIRKNERWDIQEETPVRQAVKKARDQVIELLKQVGMIDCLTPRHQEYVYAGVMGALRSRFQERLNLLIELIDKGYTFKHLVLLGGKRPLQEHEKDGLPEHVRTELDMMQYLYAHSRLANYPYIAVDAPMVIKPDGTVARPTTDDTLVYFAQQAPEDGSFLVISNNPYGIRQAKTAERVLPRKRFSVDVAATPADQEEMDVVMLMDEFARTLYEVCKTDSI